MELAESLYASWKYMHKVLAWLDELLVKKM